MISDRILCPYCGAEVEYGKPYKEKFDAVCQECSETFLVRTEEILKFITFKRSTDE